MLCRSEEAFIITCTALDFPLSILETRKLVYPSHSLAEALCLSTISVKENHLDPHTKIIEVLAFLGFKK